MDKTKYPDNWDEISQRIRTERADNKCEICKAPNGAYIQRRRDGSKEWRKAKAETVGDDTWYGSVKIVLTVAHLDHDTTHNDDFNLAALCQRCHLRHDVADNQNKAAVTKASKKAAKAQQGDQPANSKPVQLPLF